MFKGLYKKDDNIVPYIRKNFKIKAHNATGEITHKTTGGIYKKMLEAANDNFNIDQFVSEIVERTGPNPSSKDYRRFYYQSENEYSKNAYSKYGYSLSDLDKAMDAIIADIGAQALEKAKVTTWNEYKEIKGLNDEDVPVFIQENYLFCVSSGGVGKSLTLLKTNAEKQKVISWELDQDRAFYVLKSRGSSINERKYEDVVNYSLTGKAPTEHNNLS